MEPLPPTKAEIHPPPWPKGHRIGQIGVADRRRLGNRLLIALEPYQFGPMNTKATCTRTTIEVANHHRQEYQHQYVREK
jgi:hypothetical protein